MRVAGGEVAKMTLTAWSNRERNAHRMSVEWSRIEPADGHYDSAAIDRYRAMLTGLRQRDIEPMVTLHHFTNPLWLEQQGGWETVDFVVLRFQ